MLFANTASKSFHCTTAIVSKNIATTTTTTNANYSFNRWLRQQRPPTVVVHTDIVASSPLIATTLATTTTGTTYMRLMSTLSTSTTTSSTGTMSNDPECYWCCTASMNNTQHPADNNNNNNSNSIAIQHIAGYLKDTDTNTDKSKSRRIRYIQHPRVSSLQQQSACDNNNKDTKDVTDAVCYDDNVLDFTKAADWMEYMEYLEKDHRTQQFDGGAGAYDTLRCDMIHQQQQQDEGVVEESKCPKWNVWGQDFHLDRLQQSYQSLLDMNNNNTNRTLQSFTSLQQQQQQQQLTRARNQSIAMLDALLEEAGRADILQLNSMASHQTYTNNNNNNKGIQIHLVRLTWLWSPPMMNDTRTTDIVVRAHAVCMIRPIPVQQTIQPITCTIALELHNDNDNDDNNNENNSNKNDNTSDAILPRKERLPNRLHHSPQSKIASWTRLRKQLEHPETYKPSYVAEVLLVRQPIGGDGSSSTSSTTASSNVELLEGLSSNIFVLYHNGTLHTPEVGVLHGYVRHLTLECAREVLHLPVDTMTPIRLQDVSEWKEAFITSSSRLIYPIDCILIRDNNKKDSHGLPAFREFWHAKKVINETPIWQKLRNEILRRGGYPIL